VKESLQCNFITIFSEEKVKEGPADGREMRGGGKGEIATKKKEWDGTGALIRATK